MNLSNDELRSLLHNVISCYRDHINVYRTANPEDDAVNDVMGAAQLQMQRTGLCSHANTVMDEVYGEYCTACNEWVSPRN